MVVSSESAVALDQIQNLLMSVPRDSPTTAETARVVRLADVELRRVLSKGLRPALMSVSCNSPTTAERGGLRPAVMSVSCDLPTTAETARALHRAQLVRLLRSLAILTTMGAPPGRAVLVTSIQQSGALGNDRRVSDCQRRAPRLLRVPRRGRHAPWSA